MKSPHVISYPIWLIAFHLATVTSMSTASGQDCTTIRTLRSYSDDQFRSIKGAPHDDVFTSTLILPNANTCEIDEISPDYSKYTCEWFLVRGRNSQDKVKHDEAKATYDEMVNSLKLCVPNPTSITKNRFTDERGVFIGEETRLEDPYLGIAPHHSRYATVSYNYRSRWWTLSLTYGRYEGPKL